MAFFSSKVLKLAGGEGHLSRVQFCPKTETVFPPTGEAWTGGKDLSHVCPLGSHYLLPLLLEKPGWSPQLESLSRLLLAILVKFQCGW